jgi:hypothetical protein
MPISGLWLGLAAVVALAALVLARVATIWLRYRGRRVVKCPETQRSAGVAVDSGHAALTSLGSHVDLRLSSCSRWPEKAGCGQPCLAEIAASPEDCLVRTILTKWYHGKACASCGRPFGEIQWAGAQPALMAADKISVEWTKVAPEKLDEFLATASPVCFACHTANSLVREHPELVVNRSRAVER